MELGWEGLIYSFSRVPMFPFFDMAHYLMCVMSLKKQPGIVEVSQKSPVACWLSAMLHCFGGGILSSLLLAEPPVEFLVNHTNIYLASSIWYLIFYCPHDLFYQCFSFPPLQILAAGMKEVTRTWKILGGIAHANSHYKNDWLIMIAIGWARGAGGGLISNFEQLLRGVWRPESNEFLQMSYPVKVTLLGAVLFTLQHTKYLPIEKHNLMFFYTSFLVFTKVTMMLVGCADSPIACLETLLSRVLFSIQQASPEVKDAVGSRPCDSTSCPTNAPCEGAVCKKSTKKME
ncbi:trimeric intracellular cation channel type B isoform X1 [Tachyglossus aculeatus]|uniref:trimeric intracellular cation channel type B isoform X1 n=2 Tax=Tachyglossus aculeatus TaxID=9261 RepID=UPI0018F302F3|nr:trimeric intracellular cation channel type B isoform X1 [Tachyglossus aculeatus]